MPNLIFSSIVHIFLGSWLVLNACQSSDSISQSNHLLSENLDSLLESSIQLGQIPGAVLLIAKDGEIMHHKAYGHAQLFEYGMNRLERPPVLTVDHRFDLASLTKVFATTLSIMVLVEQQRIVLDDPVHRYLPEFRDQHKDSITVRHLLTHSSGLHPWKPTYYHASYSDEVYRYICSLPLAYPVGLERHYSDLGFMLLGYLIEEVTGLSLDQFVLEEIYHPLQLYGTSFNPDANDGPFAATSHGNPFEKRMVEDDDFGYRCDESPDDFTGWRDYTLVGEVNDGNAFYAHKGVAGHAGLFSTATDLKILLDLLMNGGSYSGRRIVSENVIDTFLTKDQFDNGLGWAMSSSVLPVDELPQGSFGHTGFTGTYALAIPSAKLSIILLTNRQNLGVDASTHYPSLTNLRKDVVHIVISHFLE